MKATPPDFKGEWEEWMGIVLGKSKNPAGWEVVLTLRDDTGELVEFGRNTWYSLRAQHSSGDIVKILWEPDV
jgi:hypothetical protein